MKKLETRKTTPVITPSTGFRSDIPLAYARPSFKSSNAGANGGGVNFTEVDLGNVWGASTANGVWGFAPNSVWGIR